MKFTYGLAGWEKSTHNRRILRNKIETKEFQILIGKYYLRNAEYSNLDYLLILYKRI